MASTKPPLPPGPDLRARLGRSRRAAMVRRGAARTIANRQLSRALDAALPPEVDE